MPSNTSDMFSPEYPKDFHAQIEPEPLDEQAILQIGRIIRAWATIENVLDLFLEILAGGLTDRDRVLLGNRLNFRAKVEKCETLAALRPDDASEAVKAFRSRPVRTFQRVRNALAHGAYLGTIEVKGQKGFAFQTDKTILDEDPQPSTEAANRFGVELQVFSASRLALFADEIGRAQASLVQLTKTQSLLEKQQRQDLQPHPKGRKGEQSRKKHQPPPQSSPE